LELSNRYSSTDYIDDASNRYFNYTEMAARKGIEDVNKVPVVIPEPTPQQVYFSDRHIAYDGDGSNGIVTPYPSGYARRGNPKYNDAYVLTLVTLHYKLKKGKSSLPKFK